MTLTLHQWHKHQHASYWQSIACTSVALSLALWGISKPISRTKSVLFFSALACVIVARSSHKQYLDHHENISAFNQLERSTMIEGKTLHYKDFYAIMHKPDLLLSTATLESQPILEASSGYYDWANIESESVGFLICGNSGSAKSSLATWLAGHLTQHTPMAVLALDPHYNDCWELAGIRSVGEIEVIESCLIWLIEELDRRCKRKGKKEYLGDPLFIICDELNAAIERFSNKKIIESALKRLGSEGRKFDITFCGLNQSSNAGAIGIDAKYKSNYSVILLGQSARTHPKLGAELKNVAYPCMLTGSIADSIAFHPTHGDYKTFKKKGNAPMNLKPINQIPLPEDLSMLLAEI